MNNSTIAECVEYVRPHEHQVLLWDLLYDLRGSGLRVTDVVYTLICLCLHLLHSLRLS